MCLQGGALVSSASTEQEVHQPSKNYTVYLVGAAETAAPPEKSASTERDLLSPTDFTLNGFRVYNEKRIKRIKQTPSLYKESV